MSRRLRLIVTDTSPLITLALAKQLDLLLRPGVSVNIPDAVYVEATRVRTAKGAESIVDWLTTNADAVRIAPTETGIDQLRRLEEGRSIRGLGEAAAIEALNRYLGQDPETEALLLFEDSDIMRRRAIVDERVSLISTGDFLRELERAHLIQSSDHVLDMAAAAGRNVDRQRSVGTERPASVLRDHLDAGFTSPKRGGE